MREDDWKIHTLMGNDLTGWEWGSDTKSIAVKYINRTVKCMDIPHYSTTWEGAGLVMDWLDEQGIPHSIKRQDYINGFIANVRNYPICDATSDDISGPLALAQAFISAMEERHNG